MVRPAPKTSRAVQLVEKVLTSGIFDEDALAQELVITRAALTSYRTGKKPMPLDRQLCLAVLLIEKVPGLAREGRQLRSQVQAAMAYEAHDTTTHKDPPPPGSVW